MTSIFFLVCYFGAIVYPHTVLVMLLSENTQKFTKKYPLLICRAFY